MVDHMTDVSKMTATERYEHNRKSHEDRQKVKQAPHDLRVAEREKAEWLKKEKEGSNG